LTTVLANLFFFSALLPFLAPLPAPSDVQWPVFLIAILIVARDVVRGRFILNWVEYVFLAIGIWSLCFVLPGNPFNGRERIGILMAFLAYYVVRKHAPRFSVRVLMAAIAITLVAAILQLGWPSVYAAVAPYFVRTVKDLSEGGRGASGPSAEPSFLAAMALVHGLLVIYYYSIGRMSRRAFRLGAVMSVVSLLLSRSATGFMYVGVLAFIAAGYSAFRGMPARHWAALLISIAVLFAIVIGPLAESRGGVILVDLYQKPDEVLGDGSAQERVRCLAIGILSLPAHPLGAGGGAYPDVAVEMNNTYGLDRVFARARREALTGVLNATGMYLAELGIVFVFFLGVLLLGSLQIEVFHLLFVTLALLFMSFSFSITLPMTWLLLGLTARRDMLVKWLAPLHVQPRPQPLPSGAVIARA
jgi:hypothetical protein